MIEHPLMLDLFCGAGGAGHGYQQAGFVVYGVDISERVRAPYPMAQGNALLIMKNLLDGKKVAFYNQGGMKALRLSDFSAIHASPPCQRYSVMTNGRWKDRVPNHPDLIMPIRKLLRDTNKPYVIENVVGARKQLVFPIMLCGTMFGLQTKHGSQLRRHRLFELSWADDDTPGLACQHNTFSAIGVYGGGQNPGRKRVPATIGVWGHAGGTSNRDGLIQFGTQDRRDAMGIQWMTGKELSEAIPPAYTKYVGERLIKEAL